MTCREQEEDLAPDEASGVLCRCGHLLTDSDLHFCGYCGSVIQVTSGRRQAPAAVASGRRAALAALASERNADPAEPVTDRFVAPAVRALHPVPPPPAAAAVAVVPSERTPAPVPTVTTPPVTPPPVTPPPVTPPPVTPPPVTPPPVTAPTSSAPTASAALAAADLAAAAETALAAAPVASATRAAKAAKAARATRANKPARVARGVGVTATPSAPEPTPGPASAAPTRAPTHAPAPAVEPEADTPSPPATAPPGAGAAPPPATSAPPAEAPGDGLVPIERGTRPSTDETGGSDGSDEAGEPEPEVAPRATVFGRRSLPAWVGVGVIVGACAVRTALGLLFTYPGYLSWLPVVLVATLALLKVARFSIGLVGVATAAVAAWWVLDHVVSTARLQALGYDIGQSTVSVPGLVAAVGSVPLAVGLCVLVDGHVRARVRAWVVPPRGLSSVRAAAVVLAVLAALFPVARSVSTQPGFAVLTAARDQVRYPGYPTPGEIADRMHAMSVSKGRPVSMTCTYAPDDGAGRPSYQCVGISQVGSEAAQVHDGIRSTVLPDGTYSCVDFTSGVDRRLC